MVPIRCRPALYLFTICVYNGPMGADTLTKPTPDTNPWRRIFENVREVVGNKRDAVGVVGSINWLRKRMEQRGANPNVVRNIIYRDKGKLSDKRVLFEILSELWTDAGKPPLQVPELEVLLAASTNDDQEVMQLLGREKRRAYQSFVSGVRSALHPKLLVTGKPGSGKTLLTDYIQQALELPPRAAETILRQEFGGDLAAALSRLAASLGVSVGVLESRLVKIGVSSAFSVQADAQADVARVILDGIRLHEGPLVLLLHLSQSTVGQDHLGAAPLRLSTADVPRVNVAEWLWVTLLEPLSHMPHVSLLVSTTSVPARVLGHLGAFEGPVKLNPPTVSEARRFVKARVPHLPQGEQEVLVNRAKRSFEDLRTLTLLAEIREPLPEGTTSSGQSDRHIEQLSQLALTSSEPRLRDFLSAVAVLSLPEPNFSQAALSEIFPHEEPLSSLESAFLDTVPGPGETGYWRCFSRQLVRALQRQLVQNDLPRYRSLNAAASRHYEADAHRSPKGEEASRYLCHLLEARDWPTLQTWLSRYGAPQSLLQGAWQAATEELRGKEVEGSGAEGIFEAIALQVAAHYVKLGSFEHPDVVQALQVLADSANPRLRAWTTLKRAEGEVIKGHFGAAEALISSWPEVDDPVLNTEVSLIRASIARWRSQLDEAAALVETQARIFLGRIPAPSQESKLLGAKVAAWAGLIAKDRGDLQGALTHFASIETDDNLVRARLAFQRGDVKMALGRFGAALAEFDDAVTRSHEAEAPSHEQARYLARRANLQRLRGNFGCAERGFAQALEVLESDAYPTSRHALERAKVEDEHALNLLAQGEFERATFALQRNLATFERYSQEQEVDASFRILRSTLRLSLAYWCRALAQPFALPFLRSAEDARRHPDLAHARTLIAQVDKVSGEGRYGPLHRQTRLASSLILEPADAVSHARQTLTQPLNAHLPYRAAVSRTYLGAALLRSGEIGAALAEVERAKEVLLTLAGERDDWSAGTDSGLLAWLTALRLQAYARLGQPGEVEARLAEALGTSALQPYAEALLRLFGELAEGSKHLSWFQHEGLKRRLTLDNETRRRVRLPDALVAHWQRLDG